MQPPDSGQPEPSRPQNWLRVVRLLALCTVVAITVVWYVAILQEPVMQKSDLLIPLYFAPLWSPYLWIFLRLNSAADRAKKKALALAVSWGMLGFLLFAADFALMVPSVGFISNDWEDEVVFGCLALLQLSLIAASIKAYLSTKPELGDGRILLWRLGIACSIILTFLLAFPFIIRWEKGASNEASAIGALRTINVAQTVYAQGHPDRGFAASLAELGPSPGAELIDGILAGGKKSGYVITMSATPPDSAGRIKAYTLIARPHRFGKDETRSFFTDESGALHATPENRAPTIQDPVL